MLILTHLTGFGASAGGGRSFTISPSVSGKSVWDLDVDGPLNLGAAGTWTIVPSSTFTANLKAWGAGGAGGNYATPPSYAGGGGGYGAGVITFESGLTYTLVVGQGGRTAIASGYNSAATPNGGRSAGQSGNFGAGGGGGRSEITRSGTSIFIVPGGGGGGTQTGTSRRGGGGGDETSGQAGENANSGGGGTSSAGGAGGNPGSGAGNSGASKQGGDGHSLIGGGGGDGYYGGGGGGYTTNIITGGGGGSAFKNPTYVTSTTFTAANYETPGNSGDSDRGGSADGGAISTAGDDGRLILA